ncbi:hypothetical protein C4K38_1081 [Pseudomonas chlororaphis subsp. piscium]|uniref:hypothetical protein n=1 Tax=Pseudomonas chlororaphis TaxID=587753 RepID=UPI0006A6060D|nr:hypothetical protein [Pseudomonas chlororaphis]AZC29060.1 hypothetical protein C4K38_1081 [Pseudomonas chlororaphis subsp. piscium]WDG93052.1 hypothetical protein PUP49_06425 [Pseudomonas chlororaphis]SDT43750.1 hypothetical protein SAMN05216585_6289 [Pseudomonas chlororaphis]
MAIKHKKPVLAYYTRFLFLLTCKFPKLFTYSFKSHFFFCSTDLLYPKVNTVVYDQASILEGPGQWRAVNIITPITPSELMSLREWFQKKEFPHHEEGPESSIPHTETAIFAVKGLGYIPFNDTYPYDPSRISVKTKAFRTCTITTIELTNSVTYLSLDFFLRANFQNKLFNINTSKIIDYHAFKTANPFSRNFRIVRSSHYVEEQLIQGVNKIVGDAHQVAEKLFKLWSISSEIRTRITTGQLKSEYPDQYINRYASSDYNHYNLISRYPSAEYNHYSDETCFANYIYDLSLSSLNIDAFFIDSLVDPDNIRDYLADHLNLSLIKEVWHQYNQCRDIVNPVLSTISQNTSESLQVLLEANLQIERIEEKIEALMQFTEQYYCRVFRAEAEDELNRLTAKVEVLKKRIAQRKSLSNDQVQFENLKFNRFYAWIVGGLAFLQVFLAAIVIDWSQALQSNNPVLNNLKALLRWLQG